MKSVYTRSCAARSRQRVRTWEDEWPGVTGYLNENSFIWLTVQMNKACKMFCCLSGSTKCSAAGAVRQSGHLSIGLRRITLVNFTLLTMVICFSMSTCFSTQTLLLIKYPTRYCLQLAALPLWITEPHTTVSWSATLKHDILTTSSPRIAVMSRRSSDRCLPSVTPSHLCHIFRKKIRSSSFSRSEYRSVHEENSHRKRKELLNMATPRRRNHNTPAKCV